MSLIPKMPEFPRLHMPELASPEELFPPGTHLLRDAAQIFFESLREHMQAIEQTLAEKERLALIHTQTGEAIVITSVSFANPSAIIVAGFDSDQRRSVVYAHLNSFQMLFKIIEAETDEPRRPIGFHME